MVMNLNFEIFIVQMMTLPNTITTGIKEFTEFTHCQLEKSNNISVIKVEIHTITFVHIV